MTFMLAGECCKCGQCCGAEGSPNQASPWPRNFLPSRRNWPYERFIDQWPLGVLFGIVQGEDGKPKKSSEHGAICVPGGDTYYYVWESGRPCKDISVKHDGSAYSLECVFLKDDPGDGTRECGLVETGHEHYFLDMCLDFCPPFVSTSDDISLWEENHPLCSFEWVEV